MTFMYLPLLVAAVVSDTVIISFASSGVTLIAAFIGFLQWRKTHDAEGKKTVHEVSDKFRDDIMLELNTVRQRMDSLMTVNAMLIGEKATFQVQIGQQQTQMMELNRRLDEVTRSRDLFEQRVTELTKQNTEQRVQIETMHTELDVMRLRIKELEGRNTHD